MNNIAILIKKANLEFDKIANQILAPYELTHTQFKILKFLYKAKPNTVRQLDIERFYSMTNPTVSGIIQNLEKKELVIRAANPKDGRSKVIDLTERAYTMETDLEKISEELEDVLTANLNKEEQVELCRLLNKMLA